MTNGEGGAILRNMKYEYVNGGMLSTAQVRGDIGDPTNLLIHRYEVTAEREKKASKGNKMGREQRCFAKWCFRILSKFCFVMILCSVKKYFAQRRTINTMIEKQKANYWSKSRIYADFKIFCANFSEAESTFALIQTFLAGLLGADNNSNIRRSVQRPY